MLKFFILVFFAAASASVIHEGTCPESIKPLENFNFDAFQGLWYEYAKFPTVAEKNAKCGEVEYTKVGDTIKVKNAHVIDGVQYYIDGTARFATSENIGKLIVAFKFGDTVRENTLSIIDTDYTNYAVFFKCTNDVEDNKHEEFLWVASRNKVLEGAPMEAVTKFLKDRKFETSKLVDTDFSEDACKFSKRSVIAEYPYKN